MPNILVENKIKNSSKKAIIANALVIDADTVSTKIILEIMAKRGIQATVAMHRKIAAELLEKYRYDIIFLSDAVKQDSNSPPQSSAGLKLFEEIKVTHPEACIIIIADSAGMTYQETADNAISALKCGCSDYVLKPMNSHKIEGLLDTYLPNKDVSVIASAQHELQYLYNIVGKSRKLMQTVEIARKAAPTTVPVLVSGESGTGKELFSYFIHHNSRRANAPYVRVNCAALSEALLESELFGHEKGAFTGAHSQRKGRFETANGGTLLLDEISETPLSFQAKLLRVLEQQDFERVGGNDNIKVDVRIISTTNRNLLEEVQKGRFRQDLYYRLSGVRLVISPLRDRPEDMPDLIWHFVNMYSRQAHRRITKIDPSMIDMFMNYSWPGNIRQLRNVVFNSLILGSGEMLSVADVSWLFDEIQAIPAENNVCVSTVQSEEVQTPELGGMSLEELERRAILDTLKITAGNQTKAAKVLGISDRTLRDKIRQYRQDGCLQSIG